jgi:hypothetical protein
LPFLLPEEVADAFVEDTMADATDNEKWWRSLSVHKCCIFVHKSL